MEQTFLFEKALAETGIDQNQLPANIQTDLSELTTLCRALYDTPDENMAELEKLNELQQQQQLHHQPINNPQ
jgi:hypothetical protein